MEKRTKIEKEILRSKIKESLKLNPKETDISDDATKDNSINTKETKRKYSYPEEKQDLDIKIENEKSIATENLFTMMTPEQSTVPVVSRILPKENNEKSLMNLKLIPTSIELSNSPQASGNNIKSDSKTKIIPKMFPAPVKKEKI